MLISWKRSLLATAACLASIASMAQADILCGTPNTAGQIFKAGDIMSLSIAADGKAPLVSDVNSLTATLYCSVGTTIATIDVSPPNKPFSFTVPSVGNISTPAGTDGPCLGNKFYVRYSGVINGFLSPKFGPVPCAEIVITPGAYVPPVTIPSTIPPSSSVPTIPITSKKPPGTTTTTSTSSTPLPTETKKEDGGGGLKISTPMIVVIALAVVLILALMIVAICFRVRRQKRKRMEDAIMPWSTKPNNSQFSKMPSSMEEDRPSSSGGGSAAAAAAAAAELNGSASKTTMPKPPQLHASGKGYYGEDSYAGAGYGQQPNLRHPHGAYHEDPQDGYNNQRQPHGEYFEGQERYNIPQNGYNNPQEDYHNPYYAQQAGGAGGGYQGTGNPAAGYGYATPDGPQGHYPSHPGDHAFYESHEQYPGSAPQALPPGEGGRRRRGGGSRRKAGNGGNGEAAAVVAAAAGYYPPPPPVRGPAALALRGPTSLAPPTPNYGQLDTTELILPGAVSALVSSGNARAPQEIPELKPKSTGMDAANVEVIPMKQLPSAPHV